MGPSQNSVLMLSSESLLCKSRGGVGGFAGGRAVSLKRRSGSLSIGIVESGAVSGQHGSSRGIKKVGNLSTKLEKEERRLVTEAVLG